ncbi:SEL1 protein [Pancytospora epiphaga]|nr:SEL1 protein [Pancytospora epiphaga]
MLFLGFLVISAVAAQSLIERLVFEEGNIVEALKAEPQTEFDSTVMFFIEKTFGGNFEKAVSYLVAKEEPSQHVLLLLSRISARERTTEGGTERNTIKLEDGLLVAYMKKICSEIAEKYTKNRYDFYDMPSLNASDYTERSDILTNIWTQDPLIVEKFFMLIGQNKLNPGDILKELEFLAFKKHPRAFGFIGDVYFYGLGVPVDIDKAVEYYMAGRQYSDPRSYLGLGRVLMHPSYNDLKGATEALNAVKGGNNDPEAAYFKYILIMSEEHSSKSLPFLHQQAWNSLKTAAVSGYLPAVYEYGINDAMHGSVDTALHTLLSVSKFSPIIMDIGERARKAYKNGEYRKALLYTLYLSEYKIDLSMQNAIMLMQKHRILGNQDVILFNLLSELARGFPRYNKHLGDCYYYGIGCKKSYENAFAYYVYSMDSSAESTYNVSLMFENGLGIKRDLDLAWKYLNSRNLTGNRLYLVVFYSKIRLFIKLGVRAVLRAYIVSFIVTMGLLCMLLFYKSK